MNSVDLSRNLDDVNYRNIGYLVAIFHFIVVSITSCLASQSDGDFGHRGRTHNIPILDKYGVNWRSEKSCGVASTYAFLRLVGIEVNYFDVLSCVPITTSGSRLSDMKQACDLFGVETELIKTSPAHLLDFENPLILHLHKINSEISESSLNSKRSGHFVVMLANDENTVTILDPSSTRTLQIVPIGDLLHSWSGFILSGKQVYEPLSIWTLIGLATMTSLFITFYSFVTRKKSGSNVFF